MAKQLNTLTFTNGNTSNTYQVSTRDFTPEIEVVGARLDTTNSNIATLNTNFLSLKDKVSNTVIPNISANKQNISTLITNLDITNTSLLELSETVNTNSQEELNKREYLTSIIIPSSGWTDNENDVYTQTITMPDTIPFLSNRYVELLLSSESLLQMIDDGISSLRVDNENGIFTIVCIGATPSAALSAQAILHYVEVL